MDHLKYYLDSLFNRSNFFFPCLFFFFLFFSFLFFSFLSLFRYTPPHNTQSAKYFADAPREFIHSLSEFLHLAIFGANEAIIRTGFTGSKMYILAKGRCQIEFADPKTGNVKIVGEIGDGSCFGELGACCFFFCSFFCSFFMLFFCSFLLFLCFFFCVGCSQRFLSILTCSLSICLFPFSLSIFHCSRSSSSFLLTQPCYFNPEDPRLFVPYVFVKHYI